MIALTLRLGGETFRNDAFSLFQPPSKPLGLRGLPTLWRNYIETIPQPAFEEAVTRGADALFRCSSRLRARIDWRNTCRESRSLWARPGDPPVFQASRRR